MATGLSTLALDIAAEESVIAAKVALAPVAKFAKSFAAAEGEAGDTVKVPVYERGVAAEFDPAGNNYTYASATAGVGGKSIELNKHPWQPRKLLPDDVMETAVGKDWLGQSTKTCVDSVARYIANKTLVEAMVNGTGSLSLGSGTALAKAKAARKAAIAAGINPAEATFLVDSDLFSDLLEALPFNVRGAEDALINGTLTKLFGFGYVAEMQDGVSYTDSTTSKTYDLNAMVVANDAIGIATRLPVVQNPDLFDVADLTSDEIGGFSIRVRSTGTNSNDAKYIGAEVIFGAKALKPAEILVAKTERQ